MFSVIRDAMITVSFHSKRNPKTHTRACTFFFLNIFPKEYSVHIATAWQVTAFAAYSVLHYRADLQYMVGYMKVSHHLYQGPGHLRTFKTGRS